MAAIKFEDNGTFRKDIYILGSTANPITTVDATPTVIFSIPTVIDRKYRVEIDFAASDLTVANGAYTGNLLSAFGRLVGNITKIGADFIYSVSGYTGTTPMITTVANTINQTIDIQITGRAATNLHWTIEVWVKYKPS